VAVEIIIGDSRTALRQIEAGSVQCVVTSPPYYWQRDYGVDGQIGLEDTPEGYVSELVSIFRDVRACLADDGVAWLNLGDAYYSGNGQPKGSDPRSPSRDWMRKKLRPLDKSGMGVPKKSLLGMPWKVAHALQADGWTIRAEIVWCRQTAFAEPSVKDRPHRQHEILFLLSKSRWYSFNRAMLPEESVWHIPHERAVRGHNAAYPEELARRCIVAGSAAGDLVLDPFGGSGTTGLVAQREGRDAVLIELNPDYAALAKQRIGVPLFAKTA
jgi:site-specific DNA-methyltransferase (adenine-specific)